MTYDEFRSALDALCPVHRAKAIVGAIEALPVGTRIGSYRREPGENRWRQEYTSIRYRRDRTQIIDKHAAYTQAWSLALAFGMPTSHRREEAELIAQAAYRVMIANGFTTIPVVSDGAPAPVFAPIEIEIVAPRSIPAPPRPGQQLALPL